MRAKSPGLEAERTLMRLFFETSMLVQALVDQLAGHESALATVLSGQKKGHGSHLSTHALAGCYTTLTALPSERRVSPSEALQLIEESILPRMQVVELGKRDYVKALARVQKAGLSSGAVYDALHLIAAEKIREDHIHTCHFNHFNPLAAEPAKLRIP